MKKEKGKPVQTFVDSGIKKFGIQYAGFRNAFVDSERILLRAPNHASTANRRRVACWATSLLQKNFPQELWFKIDEHSLWDELNNHDHSCCLLKLETLWVAWRSKHYFAWFADNPGLKPCYTEEMVRKAGGK